MCKPSLVGQPKVVVLQALVKELTEVEIAIRNQRYLRQRLEAIVIAAVDSMDVRKDIWKRVKLNPTVPLLIDPRMGAEFARIYSIRPCDPDHVEFYEANLYDGDEAERLQCSARAIICCPTIVGGIIALLVKNCAVGKSLPAELLLTLPRLLLLTEREALSAVGQTV
jgi:hypothetical protein